MNQRAGQRGFTLIELFTVLLIAGVLLTLAVPTFRDNFERRRLEGQADELATDLQYAKSEAVARNVNVVFMPGGSGSCYTLAAWAASAPGLARVGGCDCSLGANAACSAGAGNRPREMKTVTMARGSTVNGAEFEFEPVRGALASAGAASAAVQVGSRISTVNVTPTGRVSPPSP